MRDNDREARLQDVRRGYELIYERKGIDEGREIAMRIRYELATEECESAYLEWLIALSYDMTGQHLEACEFIDRAFALDPLEPAYNNSRKVIYQNLRNAFLHLDVSTAGERVAKLYATLAERGQADWDCHLHVARWYAAEKRFEEMRRVLDAVALLYPGCTAAWEGLAALGRDAKDDSMVAAAENAIAATKAPRRRKERPRA